MRFFPLKTGTLEGGTENVVKLEYKIFQRREISRNRKIQAQHQIDRVAPKTLDLETQKILCSVPEKRLKRGDQKSLSESPRTGEKNLSIPSAQIEKSTSFVDVNRTGATDRIKLRNFYRKKRFNIHNKLLLAS